MDLFGIKPDYLGAKIKPFIADERYVKTRGGKGRRLAVHQNKRQFFRVGYPILNVHRTTKEAYYEIWEANGGETFEEAQDFLQYKLQCFLAAVIFYEKYGKAPK
jgi:hypothetical protein